VITLFISREYDYALRILRALADAEQATVKQVCLREHIPQAYAYKILKKLEKASLVKGFRGTNGGYRLAAPLKSVTLFDVYIAVEGDMYIGECLRDGYICPNNKEGRQCTIHRALCQMQNHFMEAMRHRNMAEILEADR